jgi:hypothetical protein
LRLDCVRACWFNEPKASILWEEESWFFEWDYRLVCRY